MNKTMLRRIVVSVVLLVSAFIAFVLASARWDDMSHSEKPLRQAYAIWPDGSMSYGTYCNDNSTKLEGGGICYINEFSRPYTQEEIVRESIGVGLFWLVLIGAVGTFAVLLLLEPSNPTSDRTTGAVRKQGTHACFRYTTPLYALSPAPLRSGVSHF